MQPVHVMKKQKTTLKPDSGKLAIRPDHPRCCTTIWICVYRRLISKSAFMHFLAILTFLHIWKDKSQGYLKMQGPWQFLQNKVV